MPHKNIDLKIRLCELEDFSFVFNLVRTLWPHLTFNFEDYKKVYRQALESEIHKSIVALINNQIVGFCSLSITNNLWHAGSLGQIDVLVVDETIRGHGIGRELINQITVIAIQNECKVIELDSAFHRTEAHNFYEKLGYQKLGYLFSKTLNTD